MSGTIREFVTARLGHQPGDLALFERALTHSSASRDSYERLEFLGDRVLGLVIARWLYERFASEPEGNLSKRYNDLVSRETCAAVGRDLGLPALIRLGKQAREDGAQDSDNVLGDVVDVAVVDGFGEKQAQAWQDQQDEIAQLRGEAIHPSQLLWLATEGSAWALHLGGVVDHLVSAQAAEVGERLVARVEQAPDLAAPALFDITTAAPTPVSCTSDSRVAAPVAASCTHKRAASLSSPAASITRNAMTSVALPGEPVAFSVSIILTPFIAVPISLPLSSSSLRVASTRTFTRPVVAIWKASWCRLCHVVCSATL